MKNQLEFLRGVAESQDRLLARSSNVEREAERLQATREFLAPVGPREQWGTPWRWATLGAVAAVAAAAWLVLQHRPLTFQVAAGGQAELGTSVSAPESEPVAIDFSDGSTLKVAPGGRARVTHVDAQGAVVQLERGHADMAVVPRHGASWRVDAGTFRVHVKGTEFSLDWDPVGQRLDFKLRRGSVVIDGGCLQAPRALTAGESLYTSCASAMTSVAPNGVDTQPSPPPAAATPEDLPELIDVVPPAGNSAGARDANPAWRQLASSGKYREALAAAERAGFEGELQRANADDLMSLGDAARLSGNPTRALQAYLASRQRRPPARRSAFAIGLVEFDQRHAYAEAARWFGAYLREQPAGALAEQAAGRLMEAAEKAGDHATARATADKYLTEHHAGPYMDLARRLSSSE